MEPSAKGLSARIAPLVQSGRQKAAEAVLKNAARGGAPPWEISLWEGRLAEKSGRWADAERAFRKAVSTASAWKKLVSHGDGAPGDAAAITTDLGLELARFLAKRGRLEEARTSLRHALRLGAPAREIHLWEGRLEEKKKLWREAERAYRRATAADPAWPGARLELARFLEKRGRLEEAKTSLRHALRLGAPAREIHIWEGRLEKKSKLWQEAERACRRATVAAPAWPDAQPEWARFNEGRGREKGSAASLKRALMLGASIPEAHLGLAQLLYIGGRSGESETNLRRSLDLGAPALAGHLALARLLKDPRRAAKRQDLDRTEAALREAFPTEPSRTGARVLIVNLLIARGRLAPAETELGRILASETPQVEGCGAGIAALIERKRFGRNLERILLRSIQRGKTPADISKRWPLLFSALLCQRRYGAAFRLGEAMLAALGGAKDPGSLAWPWFHRGDDRSAGRDFCEAELRRLRRADTGMGFRHWSAYCRAILLMRLGRNREALAESGPIAKLAPARYAWMRLPFLLIRLRMNKPDAAIAGFRRILRYAPGHWLARCQLAEARLAKGDEPGSLRELRQAEQAGPETERAQIMTWHGAVLLWLGRYREAFAKLDAAVRMGAGIFVYCWRGAARLKLGDPRGALADLDRAVSLDPWDTEALVWRGEAYRMLGRNSEASRDLDRALADRSGGGVNCWGLFNRALVRDRLGDEAGMAADFAAIPQDMTGALRRVLHLPAAGSLSPADMRRILRAGLAAAKGIRRADPHLMGLWLPAA